MFANGRIKYIACLIVGLAVGCGEEGVPIEVQEKPPTDEIKTVLLQISEHGTVGSAGYTLRQEIDELKETDPAKAEQLSNELAELESLGDPAKIKAKAKEMAESL